MKKNIYFISLLVFSCISLISSSAQNKLTLNDIFNSSKYSSKGVANLRWMKDNISYSTLEINSKGLGYDIVKYNVKDNSKQILVDASELIPEGKKKPLFVYDYSWSDDDSKILIFTNTRRVWRYHTRGDYWVLNTKTGELIQLGKKLEVSSLMFAKFSPSGDKVAYVSKNNIYVEDLSTSSIKQLTSDGSESVINGTFDWVYEEELDDRDGFRWSPDGKTIAYWHSDTEGTGVFDIINYTDSIYSKIHPFPYPKVGTTNSAVKVGVVNIATGKSKWFKIPGDPRNHYLARMDFIPNSNKLMIQQLNRLQNTNKVFIADANTMEFTNILTETDEAFLDIHDNIVWLDKEKYFTWTSEKDGWRHLYKVKRDGSKEKLITKGEFDVIKIVCIDEKGGYVYYLASPYSAIDQYLYRSKLNGNGEAERVTPKGEEGTHLYQLTSDAKYAVHEFNNASTPSYYDIVSLPDHKTIMVLEDNHTLKAKYDALELNQKEFFKVNIGVATLDGWMIKPEKFDPNKKYPVIFQIYGEPASSTVMNTWKGGDLWHHFLAEQGYIVMSVDPRGTNMPKGREWRKCVYEKVGTIGPADHAAAVKKICKTYKFVDKDRIGIWGWSGGGASTLHAMFKYPDIYKTGIAVASVVNQKLYDTVYQERYMGLPSTDSLGFYNGSPINFVQNLKGDLLIIHGTGDDNVHYQNCELLINKLIQCNKMFNLMIYPNRTHSIYLGANTRRHLYETMDRFWLRHLQAGGE
ncbi:MAG: S9 family peptidase [Bacteroidales bacterium]